MVQQNHGDHVDDAIFEYLVDIYIADWKCKFDGEVLECTLPNKLRVIKIYPDFVKFVEECIEKQEGGKTNEKQMKNKRWLRAAK